MAIEHMSFPSSLTQKLAVAEIEKSNEYTRQFGLTLSHFDAVELVETRTLALKGSGRIEFGGGVIEKIIRAFCHSPYVSKYNYTETLHDLTEMFYYYKNETLDLISDDDLIKFMKNSFDGTCQGSLELLAGRELNNMARSLRYGRDLHDTENMLDDELVEGEEYDEYEDE